MWYRLTAKIKSVEIIPHEILESFLESTHESSVTSIDMTAHFTFEEDSDEAAKEHGKNIKGDLPDMTGTEVNTRIERLSTDADGAFKEDGIIFEETIPSGQIRKYQLRLNSKGKDGGDEFSIDGTIGLSSPLSHEELLKKLNDGFSGEGNEISLIETSDSEKTE